MRVFIYEEGPALYIYIYVYIVLLDWLFDQSTHSKASNNLFQSNKSDLSVPDFLYSTFILGESTHNIGRERNDGDSIINMASARYGGGNIIVSDFSHGKGSG